MPWHIGEHEDCSGFAVIKDGDGSVAGCHETRAEAEAQMAALYANEPEATEEGETMGELTEATKDGHAMGDFLIVGDPEEVGTWHLPVKTDGQPDRRLMGAAKAALTVGYRGNVYEGPGKQEAIRKLKAMYDAEDMEWSESAVGELDTTGMSLGALTELVRGAFDRKYYQSQDTVPIESRAYYWTRDVFMGHPILGDGMIVEHQGQLYLVPFSLDGDQVEFIEPWKKVRQTYELLPEEPGPMAEAALSESATGRVIAIEEAPTPTTLVPLTLDVALIEPGPGNSQDGHYYPAQVLRRDAGVFKGGKMYATDHREASKDVGTWVSTIKSCPVGFTESGAPIARVVVHKNWFARDIRALQAEGLLEKMECSIIGSGRAKKGKVGETEYNIVEAITEGSADWVTRAGAGGRALALAESATVPGGKMDEKENETEVQEAETVQLREDETETGEQPQEAPEGDVVDDEEKDDEDETPEADVEDTEPAEAALPDDRVNELFAESGLGEDARRLLARPYADEQAVQDAIAEFKRILKKASGSGQPFAQGDTAPAQPKKITEADRAARYKAIKESYGLTYDVRMEE